MAEEANTVAASTWIVGTIATMVVGIIGSGLTVAIYNRITGRRDARRQLMDSNTGKQIDSNDRAADRMADRVQKLEERLDEIQKQLTSQMVENAKITAAYEHSEKENERLNGEISRLRDRIHKHGDEIMARDLKIRELTAAMEAQAKRIDELATLVESYENKRKERGRSAKDPNYVKLVGDDE